MHLRIATRKSPLALAQANEVKRRLEAAWPGLSCELLHVVTSGDKFVDRPLAEIGGKGLFTKEIEEALFEGRADIAVHSMKDVQTVLPEGLVIPCLLEREDPRDRLVGSGMTSLASLPHGASFGTSSLRRAAQLRMLRPDIQIVPLRGNVQTRLEKIAKGDMQATMLAMAGLNRLGLRDVPGVALEPEEFLPAVAQGAVGIECRTDNRRMLELLAPLSHRDTQLAVACERAFLRALDGSCRTPIAGYAQVNNNEIQFTGMIIEDDGSDCHKFSMSGNISSAEELGLRLARKIIDKLNTYR